MKQLDTTFNSDGFQFTLLKRNGQVGLFSKRKPNWKDCETYEVVKIRTLPAQEIMGRSYPEREAMPVSENWGVEGWSYPTLDGARRRFSELVSSQGDVFPADAPTDKQNSTLG